MILTTETTQEDDPEFLKVVGWGIQAGLDPAKAKQYARDHLTRQKREAQRAPPPKTLQADACVHPPDNVRGRSETRVAVEEIPNHNITTTEPAVSQSEKLSDGKIIKWREVITDHCPGYRVNDRLANRHELTPTQRHCMGLFNTLMRKTGYAYASDKQLAHWLGLKPEGIRPLLRKLERRGYIVNISKRAGVHWWVVREDLRNLMKDPKKSCDGVSF